MIGDQYKLFVGGFPASMTHEGIRANLVNLGPITDIQFLDLNSNTQADYSSKRSPRPATKGYCIVTVKDKSFYYRLLGEKQLMMNGRALVISPYLTGIELFKANAFNNKRRTILKKVPNSIQVETLIDLLEWNFGKVKNLFPFRKLKNMPFVHEQSYTSYSVMFHDLRSADLAASVGYLEINQYIQCVIEKFRHSKIKNEKIRRDLNNHRFEVEYDTQRLSENLYFDKCEVIKTTEAWKSASRYYTIGKDLSTEACLGFQKWKLPNTPRFLGNKTFKLRPTQSRYWSSGDMYSFYIHKGQNLRFNYL